MARGLVTDPASRCAGCFLPPRWCVCAEPGPVDAALGFAIVTHPEERRRPSSTGRMLARVLPGTVCATWDPERPPAPGNLAGPGRELWILHPSGGEVPQPPPDPSGVRVLLIDGSWQQAGRICQAVRGWGRPVALPLSGKSRYWLRSQQEGGRFSTAEAALGALRAFGLEEERRRLELHFELHVLAHLLARGKRVEAEAYLADSPVPAALPGTVARLLPPRARRPLA